MSLPGSGSISMSQINTELGRSASSQISLDAAENGSYATINTCASPYPSSSNPASMSEWWGYNHSAACCPAYGTFYLEYCTPDYTHYYRYHNGSCGYYDVVQEYNSTFCGYNPGPTCRYYYASYDGYFDYYDCNGIWTSEYFWYGRGVCAQSAISSALYNSNTSCLV